MRTYTEHKLTDAQLRRLSAICNENYRCATAGVSGDALLRKGLVTDWRANHDHQFHATDAGHAALVQARRAGW